MERTAAAPLPIGMDVKQIGAGVLNVGYVDAGPADGSPVLLLHGWPYDIHAYGEVTPLLVEEGHRVIVPYLRGYGTTRFLSDETPRNCEQAALAIDATALMDALEIEQAVVAGFDWGARTADIVRDFRTRRPLHARLLPVVHYESGADSVGCARAAAVTGSIQRRACLLRPWVRRSV